MAPTVLSPATKSQRTSAGKQIAPAGGASLPDDFEAIRYVGGGTLAEVWQTRDVKTGELCAVKQLRYNWTEFPVARKLIENEVEVSSKVDSQYVVALLGAQLDHEPPFLVMEWLEGESLQRLLNRERRLPYPRAIWIARQCAEGLEELRQAGFTHGDIKPSNIMVDVEGKVKLLDLGFARRCQKANRDVSPQLDLITGTPEYMPPESLAPGMPWGVAGDIYSLGVTLYRMLAGQLPFQGGEQPREVFNNQRGSAPPKLRSFAADVPRELEQLVNLMLAKQPVRRPESLKQLIRQLIDLELATLSTASATASSRG